ncbi:MAG: sulfite exporter TauE/SafE family protein [Methyloligellaceae bacterium]
MPEHIPIILAGAFAGGFVLGLTGFGNGLTAYGLWLHVLSPQVGAPLVAISSITGHLLMFRGLRHAIVPSRFLPFVLGGLLGIPAGTWLLTTVSVPAFKLFAGALLAGYSVISLAGGLRFKLRRESRFLDAGIGLLGGVCGGLASLSGPIVTVWCGLKGWSKDEQRGTYQPFNFAILSAAVVAFGTAGLLTRELLWLALLTLPATLIGIWIGRRLYGRVDDAQFQKIVLALLTISGLVLVVSNL